MADNIQAFIADDFAKEHHDFRGPDFDGANYSGLTHSDRLIEVVERHLLKATNTTTAKLHGR